MRKTIIEVLNGKASKSVPFWLMRQAGRYLPEYRALRATAGSFLNLCFNPTLASEITLQPLRRFDMDAAILFSDILVIPMALGRRLDFVEGEGPRLDPLSDEKDIKNMEYNSKILDPVFETIIRTKKELGSTKTLIGFAGAPFTVACYMIDGKGGNGFPLTRQFFKTEPDKADALIAKLVDATTAYLLTQIEQGADCVQIFDSWAGMLDDALFDKYVIEPAKIITARIKQKYPDIPVIGFPRGAKDRYIRYAKVTGVNGLGIDNGSDIQNVFAANDLGVPLQGNLAPEILLAGGAAMEKEILRILNAAKGKPFIFNLGHGVIKETPPEHVAQLASLVKGFENT